MKKIFLSLLIGALTLAGCSGSSSGQITVGGSTSVEPLLTDMQDDYMAENPDIEITYSAVGSSSGITGVIDGTYEIGTASRELSSDEKSEGLTEETIAYDGIAVIVNPENGVSDLTIDQIRDIYTGKITNWSEVGGEDLAIAVYARDSSSGTRGAFEEIIGFNEEDNDPMVDGALEQSSNGEITQNISSTPSGIGYVSFDSVDETVKALNVDGVEPTPENVLSTDYMISRPFLMVYFEDEISDQSTDFINWVKENSADYTGNHNLIAP